MTTEAPKRIWAKTNAKPHEIENWYLKEPREDMTEYVRADIADEMLEALKKMVEIAEYCDWHEGFMALMYATIAKVEGDK